MHYFFLVIAFLTGIAVTVQTAVNSNLRFTLQNPVLAALISFGTGFVALLLIHFGSGGAVPPLATLRPIAWWKLMGGLIGVAYVTTVIMAVPRIGPANLVSLNVTGQLIAAVVLDHYGLLGFAQHPINGWRLLGIALLLVGVLLIVKN